MSPLKFQRHSHQPRWAFYRHPHIGWVLWLWTYHLTWYRPNYKKLAE